jgi:hypothetical protein
VIETIHLKYHPPFFSLMDVHRRIHSAKTEAGFSRMTPNQIAVIALTRSAVIPHA